MNKSPFLLAILLFNFIAYSQNTTTEYLKLVKKADSLYNAKYFKLSANKYTEAFRANKWNGLLKDRYNAACSWALSTISDSAFFHLQKIVVDEKYENYNQIISDPDLVMLHKDKRWNILIEKIKINKLDTESKLNKTLIAKLDSIYKDDKEYRNQLDNIDKKYGWQSNEMKNHLKKINKKDSINLKKVINILDEYGWLGPDEIGLQGNSTLFLVIQHSNQEIQEKYLPMMREAVKNGKAKASSLALLEDRVALRQGKRQIYGSQISRSPKTMKYFVSPLNDPDNVDKRRSNVGLCPIAEYVRYWQINWNIEQYKKELPLIEKDFISNGLIK